MDQDKPNPQIPKYRPSAANEALRQGEILSDLVQIKIDLHTIDAQEIQIIPVIHPYAIIVSQDCDLDQDYKARNDQNADDKLIPNVLLCEVTTAKLLRGRKEINSTIWSRIKINKDERYHFLEQVPPQQDALGQGLEELGVDFKRYFSVPTEEIYGRIALGEAKRRCSLKSPYLEHFASRFYHFQSRVALPEEYYSQPSE